MKHPIAETIAVFKKARNQATSEADRALIRRQIEALRDIEGSLSDYGTMRYKISSFEKLISDPWMEDQKLFSTVYDAWRQLKESYCRELGGMTVNERLCHMGLMEEFEASQDSLTSMRSILYGALLTSQNIEAIIISAKRA